jgi:hypothetical protein
LALAILFAIVAWWRFERRDIRVGGEGGWRRPSLSLLSRLLPRRFRPGGEMPTPKTTVAQS